MARTNALGHTAAIAGVVIAPETTPRTPPEDCVRGDFVDMSNRAAVIQRVEGEIRREKEAALVPVSAQHVSPERRRQMALDLERAFVGRVHQAGAAALAEGWLTHAFDRQGETLVRVEHFAHAFTEAPTWNQRAAFFEQAPRFHSCDEAAALIVSDAGPLAEAKRRAEVWAQIEHRRAKHQERLDERRMLAEVDRAADESRRAAWNAPDNRVVRALCRLLDGLQPEQAKLVEALATAIAREPSQTSETPPVIAARVLNR